MLAPSFPAANSPQRLGTTRNKVVLAPGHSLMDWIRLGQSGKDLQGFNGRTQPVTVDELAKHNKENDCWMLLRGKVYNITPYLAFHPGGIPEIMRGAGIDGTELFDEVHRWVNLESMLAKCYIGPIEDNHASKLSPSKTSGLGNKLSSKEVNQSLMPPPSSFPVRNKIKPDKPRYDWYQNGDSVIISVYSKKKDATLEDIIVDCFDKINLCIKILLGEKYYQLHLGLNDGISNLKVAGPSKYSGKFEIILGKGTKGKNWDKLGSHLDGHDSLLEERQRDLVFRDCKITSVSPITHNTNLFTVGLPDRVYYKVPIGHHVVFRKDIEGMELTRSYTVVAPSLTRSEEETTEVPNKLHFMIKIYPDGAFTPSLGRLKSGDTLTLSDCTGDFKLSRLKEAKHIYLVAAGTGLTPMIRLIRYCISEDSSECTARLLFANRREEDILWRQELDEAVKTSNKRFRVEYVLSQPSSSWSGLTGRIDKNMLSELMESFKIPAKENELIICVCGPTEFTNNIKLYLSELGHSDKVVHCFLG